MLNISKFTKSIAGHMMPAGRVLETSAVDAAKCFGMYSE